MSESPVNVLGNKRGRREDWISNATWELIQEKKALKVKSETSNLHRAKAAEVKRSSRRDRRSYYHRKIDEAEQSARRIDQRTLLKMVKELG